MCLIVVDSLGGLSLIADHIVCTMDQGHQTYEDYYDYPYQEGSLSELDAINSDEIVAYWDHPPSDGTRFFRVFSFETTSKYLTMYLNLELTRSRIFRGFLFAVSQVYSSRRLDPP